MQADQGTALEQIRERLDDLQRTLHSVLAAKDPERLEAEDSQQFTIGNLEYLQEKLQSLSLSEQNLKRQQDTLDSLTFESRPVRHSQIAIAHEKTFKWALATEKDPSLGPSIGAWLKQGDGIFWVSGKPGSGKSTLMKYIADSSITSDLITEWARPCKAAIVSHYFWITGTSMQKSQKGLLQSLLYDILRQCPDLIEQTCAERWKGCDSAGPWSLVELHEALQAFVNRDNPKLKVCFVIDGLDEYSGDHEDRTQLCQTLKSLATSGTVKLCLSSRPWNIFEEQFGLQFPKLYIQDLTQQDIQNYATSRLETHTRWAAVSAKHSQGQWLVSEIVAKSNGVFLWVVLVTKLLREGLTNRDAFVDLRRRLESFPSELEPFFKTMLEAVEDFYYSHMSTALQIANASTESHLSFLIYNFHFQEYEDSNYAIDHPIQFMNEGEIEEIRDNTSWHIDSRTRGLLEVNPHDGTVTVLHRTVRDFLKTREMYEFLIAKTDSRLNFCPILSILKAHIAMIKISIVPYRTTSRIFGKFETASSFVHESHNIVLKLVTQALRYASELEFNTSYDIRHHALLDELDRTLLSMLSKDNCDLLTRSWSKMKQEFFREQLLELGLFDYLHSKLDCEPDFLKHIKSLPILRFFSPEPSTNKNVQLNRGRGIDVLVHLLKNRGIDPNKGGNSQGISPWSQLLALARQWSISERKTATRFLSLLLEEGIIELFLIAEADPGASIAGSTPDANGSRFATVVYLDLCFDVLSRSPPIQALYLHVLLRFLQLSSDEVLKSATEEFCAALNNEHGEELQWNLPFFAKVANMIRLTLSSRGPRAEESLRSLHHTGKRIFPLNLYTTETVATKSRGRKRKQGSSSDRRRKNRRET